MFLCTCSGKSKDLYYSHLHAHRQSAFRQWIPVNWDRSCACESLCSLMKERNNLMGAWGFQDVMAELGGRALLPAIRRTWRRQHQLSWWEMCSTHSHKDAGGVAHLRLITAISAVGVWGSITEDPFKIKEIYEKGGRYLNLTPYSQCYYLSYHFWFSCAA